MLVLSIIIVISAILVAVGIKLMIYNNNASVGTSGKVEDKGEEIQVKEDKEYEEEKEKDEEKNITSENPIIGDKVEYSSNGISKWIILGEDQNGNMLITTKEPIGNSFKLNHTANAWLNYEEDINNACEKYGGTINNKKVTARSITLADINNITGVVEPEFETYTFGLERDYENKKVDYFYPSKDGKNGWKKIMSYADNAEIKNNYYGYTIYKASEEKNLKSELWWDKDGKECRQTLDDLNNFPDCLCGEYLLGDKYVLDKDNTSNVYGLPFTYGARCVFSYNSYELNVSSLPMIEGDNFRWTSI